MYDNDADGRAERAQMRSRIGDALLLGIASTAAAVDDGLFHWKVAISVLVTASVLWLIGSRALGQYSVSNGRSFLGDIALTLVLISGIVAPIAIVILLFPGNEATLHPGRSLIALVPTALLLRMSTVGRALWSATPRLDVLIVGLGSLGRLTGDERSEGVDRRRIVGCLRFEDEAVHDALGAPMLGNVSAIEAVLRLRAVDEVFFAPHTGDQRPEVQAAIHTCETLGVPFALPACPFRMARARVTPRSAFADGYSHFLSVPRKPRQRILKRIFDIAASATALAILSPLLLAAAALVKLTSRGPVLFRQERMGLHGRTFHMVKFRSMVVNAEQNQAQLMAHNEQSGPVFKMKHDPRVTRFGRFMRKHSIDELPQLMNVLRGDMSVVGPRPPVPSEVACYEAWQFRRLSVRPGLTCVWQVSGRNEISFADWMLLDMRYIDHWSLAWDFNLIWKTLPVVLNGRGAS